MEELNKKLKDKYQIGEIKMGGDFCFLENKGLELFIYPNLTVATNQQFYLGHFFTGLPKFSFIKMVIGFNKKTKEFKLLCNPLFSDEYNSLLIDFNEIETKNKENIVSEIIDILKLTGANITRINSKRFEYQIWFSDMKWRTLSFGESERIEIKTTPNNA